MLAAALVHSGQHEEARKIVRAVPGQTIVVEQSLRRLLTGTEPKLVQARERLFETLRRLDASS
ncbi:MAG: hypothetical protein JNL30_16930 [Rubrivivax sp.]|nr:hypothetical protein [Rubrivivax sp.]